MRLSPARAPSAPVTVQSPSQKSSASRPAVGVGEASTAAFFFTYVPSKTVDQVLPPSFEASQSWRTRDPSGPVFSNERRCFTTPPWRPAISPVNIILPPSSPPESSRNPPVLSTHVWCQRFAGG